MFQMTGATSLSVTTMLWISCICSRLASDLADRQFFECLLHACQAEAMRPVPESDNRDFSLMHKMIYSATRWETEGFNEFILRD